MPLLEQTNLPLPIADKLNIDENYSEYLTEIVEIYNYFLCISFGWYLGFMGWEELDYSRLGSLITLLNMIFKYDLGWLAARQGVNLSLFGLHSSSKIVLNKLLSG